MNHPHNQGVNQAAPIIEGLTRDWKVNSLKMPGIVYTADLYASHVPKGKVNTKEAREFSLLRKKVWKGTKPLPTEFVEKIHPRLELNNTKRPKLTQIAKATPTYADIRNFVLYGFTTGRLSYCLSDDEVIKASQQMRYAPNPYLAFATGGFRFITKEHIIRPITIEDALVAAELVRSRDFVLGRFVSRYDQPNQPHEDLAGRVDPTKIGRLVNPYLQARQGVIPKPTSMLLEDEAEDLAAELAGNLNVESETSYGDLGLQEINFLEMFSEALYEEELRTYRPLSPTLEEEVEYEGDRKSVV